MEVILQIFQPCLQEGGEGGWGDCLQNPLHLLRGYIYSPLIFKGGNVGLYSNQFHRAVLSYACEHIFGMQFPASHRSIFH